MPYQSLIPYCVLAIAIVAVSWLKGKLAYQATVLHHSGGIGYLDRGIRGLQLALLVLFVAAVTSAVGAVRSQMRSVTGDFPKLPPAVEEVSSACDEIPEWEDERPKLLGYERSILQEAAKWTPPPETHWTEVSPPQAINESDPHWLRDEKLRQFREWEVALPLASRRVAVEDTGGP